MHDADIKLKQTEQVIKNQMEQLAQIKFLEEDK